MLNDHLNRNKENIYRFQHSQKEPSNLLQSTVVALKDQISALKQDKINIQKQWIAEVEELQLQIGQYKKKLSAITDKYLLETFTKDHQAVSNPKDYEQIIREKDVLLQQERQNRKRVQEQLQSQVQTSAKQQKEIEQLRLQKQKNMEISLMEKIDLQEKSKLLEQQIKSKKNIISNLKKELDKIYSEKESLNKQQRSLAQKSKELECYSKEISEYNRLNELKMKQQVSQLAKQNQFLKEYVKRIEKVAKKDCECESKDQKTREKMYQIKRQLALAKVKLGENYFMDTKKKNYQSQSSEEDSNYSFQVRKK